MKIISKNKKAFHDYHILDKFEAGVVLEGSEVKSIREGRVNLKDSFIKSVKDELFLFNAHISFGATTHSFYRPNERRDRKLLLHRKEINKIMDKVAKAGMTVVPLKLYFSNKNIVKIEIALAKGKDKHDKREALKEKDQKRDMQMALKSHFK
jgi:SsrA-binding protein